MQDPSRPYKYSTPELEGLPLGQQFELFNQMASEQGANLRDVPLEAMAAETTRVRRMRSMTEDDKDRLLVRRWIKGGSAAFVLGATGAWYGSQGQDIAHQALMVTGYLAAGLGGTIAMFGSLVGCPEIPDDEQEL